MILVRLAVVDLTANWSLKPQRLHAYRSTHGLLVEPDEVPSASEPSPEDSSGTGPTFSWTRTPVTIRVPVKVETPAGPLTLNDGSQVVIPEEPRKQSESAIREYADLLSVTYQARRLITSPVPCVAIRPSTQEERALLAHAKGIAATSPRSSVPRMIGDPSEIEAQLLKERWDGVALLADALSQEDPLGKIAAFFRFFERAFKSEPKRWAILLSEFLSSGDPRLEFSRGEVESWRELRHIVVHADEREEFARPYDAEQVIVRVEYAAFDVLFNKAAWRRASAERRKGITLAAGPSRDAEQILLFRRDAGIAATWLDPFGAFPLNFEITPVFDTQFYTHMPSVRDETGAWIVSGKFTPCWED